MPALLARTARLFLGAVLVAGLLLIAAALAARYYFLPNINDYREAIASAASRAANHPLTIGAISGDWDGLHPQFRLRDVKLYDAEGKPAFSLDQVDVAIAWRALIVGEVQLHALEIVGPHLEIRRDASGTMHVASIALKPSGGRENGGFSEWLLSQDNVIVRDGTVVWRDELKGAPPLVLERVNLRLRNSGNQHRLELAATPPAELGAPLSASADWRGDLREAQWQGQAQAEIPRADVSALKAWVSFPGLEHGAGALRSTIVFREGRPQEINAEFELSGIRASLTERASPLELAKLAGRLRWEKLKGGHQIAADALSFAPVKGAAHPPTDVFAVLIEARDGQPGSGEMRITELHVAPILALLRALPLEDERRQQLIALDPTGGVHDATLKWSGEWPNWQSYRAAARLKGLGWQPYEKLPGAHNVSANVTASDKGGVVELDSAHSSVDFPRLFPHPISFDTLKAEVSWARSKEGFELKFDNAAFANSHAAGYALGRYVTGEGKGSIDLSGGLSRADASHVWRYVPLTVAEKARTWIEKALQQGHSNSVTLKLKGRLADFPFGLERPGLFEVRIRAKDGVLQYADKWPRIENIAADVVFQNRTLSIESNDASILGAKLKGVRATIPDLKDPERVLNISGTAEGASREFLIFIEQSPLAEGVGAFTRKVEVEGPGRLALKLEIPLKQPKETELAGQFQISNNRIRFHPDAPALERASAEAQFSRSGVQIDKATALVYGSPLSLSGSAERGGTMKASASGRINVAKLREHLKHAALERLDGETAWRGSVHVQNKVAQFGIESDLEGLRIGFPAPIGKAPEMKLSSKLEGRIGEAQAVSLGFGDVLAARTAGDWEKPRVTVHFGGPAPTPTQTGLWVSGSLPAIDVDEWQQALDWGGGSERTAALPAFRGADLKIAALTVGGRKFTELEVHASRKANAWNVKVAGDQLLGTFAWNPESQGSLNARFARLTIPVATAPAPERKRKVGELPAVELTADEFQVGTRKLGALQVTARPQGEDWRLQALKLENPAATLTANGLWQTVAKRTQLNMKLEVNNIEQLLVRLDYPDAVKNGSATMEGLVSWIGAPYALDYPTLSGELKLQAHNGRFAKLKPGIGKLLGVLSLQTLPRRMQLDFKDIFSEGYTFDSILATLDLNRGMIATDDLTIVGPAATILMRGQVNIPEESQNIRVTVVPAIGGSVAVAAALLANPVAGAAAYVLQKILKDPLSKLVSYEYAITGSWSDPVVSKLKANQPATQQGESP